MLWDAAFKYNTLLKINNAIVSATSQNELFKSLADELSQVLIFDRLSINIYIPHTQTLSYFATAEGTSPVPSIEGDRPLDSGAIAKQVIRSKKPFITNRLEDYSYWESVRAMLNAGLTTTIAIPLIIHDEVIGSFHLSFKISPPDLDGIISFCEELVVQIAIAVNNMLLHIKMKSINDSLLAQKKFLLEESPDGFSNDQFHFVSNAMQNLMRQVHQIARSDASILLTGETGTGKDFVAKLIHNLSRRKEALFVKINCPSLAPSLFESELFGHEKGAFTGAGAKRAGRFEMADGGTIFLDEVAEIPIELQAKLLQVLQDRQFERVGSTKPIKSDFRVISATNVQLEEAIKDGRFRSDLYYRLNMINLHIPPLKDRPEDVPLLITKITENYARQTHSLSPVFTPGSMDMLQKYYWPGNVRELKNMVKRLIILHPGDVITTNTIKPFLHHTDTLDERPISTISEMECRHIKRVLEVCNGKISGPKGAAKLLGLPRSTLMYRLKRYKLDPKNFIARSQD